MLQRYQIVLLNGRIIDPESGTDFIGNLGIDNGVIKYLGKDSIKAGAKAMLLGLVLVFIFMIIYYKGAGLIANFALLILKTSNKWSKI